MTEQATTQPSGCPNQDELSAQLHEMDLLTQELKRLSVNHEDALQHEGVQENLQTLERWAESYRRGLSAARKLTQHGPTWLNELKERLKLAADEIHRFEEEGGNEPTPEQHQRAEELLRAKDRIEHVIPNLEQLFHLGEVALLQERELAHH